MALQKEIISNNGAIATYHRIKSVVKNYKNLEVCLECYATQEYRKKEKIIFEIIANLDSITLRYSELSGMIDKNMTGEEISERDELKDKLDAYEIYLQKGQYSLYNINAIVSLENTEDISFNAIYNAIKENHQMFKDAVNC